MIDTTTKAYRFYLSLNDLNNKGLSVIPSNLSYTDFIVMLKEMIREDKKAQEEKDKLNFLKDIKGK